MTFQATRYQLQHNDTKELLQYGGCILPKLGITRPWIRFYVVQVAFVQELISTELLVCPQAVAIEALIGAVQKVVLH